MTGQAQIRSRATGFTLVEMVVTVVVFGMIAVSVSIFFKPAFDIWWTSRSRAALVGDVQTVLRVMLREVRSAVPNSIRTPDSNCFELVPSKGGGRYRLAPDTVNAGSAAADPAGTTSSFDVLTPLSNTPDAGDWVVVDNQNAGDVYSGINRSAVVSVGSVAANLGRHRLTIAPLQFPLGYDGGRFMLVDKDEGPVFYACRGTGSTLDANGNAPGVLVRLHSYGYNSAAPTSCPSSTALGRIVATGLRSCRFVYTANQGATQQSGYIALQLEFTRNGETASLLSGAHVVNAP